MPIRFRCAYCNQLMGISRRKAGTVVRCPNCAGQVIVPSPAEQSVPQQPASAPAPAPVLFEGSDFDKLFEPNTVGAPQPASVPHPAPIPQPAPFSNPMAAAAFDVEPVPVPRYQGPGIFLTPLKLTILSVSVVILLGLAFLIGFLVGRS
jgi:hypothetical protein